MFRNGNKSTEANNTLPTTRTPTCWENSRCNKDPQFRNRMCCLFTLIGILIASILIGMSLKKVSSTEYGVSYTKYSKQLADAAKSGGLYAGPPGFTFIKFPSVSCCDASTSAFCSALMLAFFSRDFPAQLMVCTYRHLSLFHNASVVHHRRS